MVSLEGLVLEWCSPLRDLSLLFTRSLGCVAQSCRFVAVVVLEYCAPCSPPCVCSCLCVFLPVYCPVIVDYTTRPCTIKGISNRTAAFTVELLLGWTMPWRKLPCS